MKIKWKDATMWARGDDKSAPRTWKIGYEAIRITVTRHVLAGANQWVCHCDVVGLDTHLLGNTDIDQAKVEAIRLVSSRVHCFAAYIDRIVHDQQV